jgi:putative endonuclease
MLIFSSAIVAGIVTFLADSSHRDRMMRLIRQAVARAGDIIDCWYEELPARRRIPLGPRGEQIAARYLQRRGYQILTRNYRAAGAEVDIIAVHDGAIVFVEVKTRSGTEFGAPREAVDEQKRDQIRRAATAYVAWRGGGGIPARFDVIAITGTGRGRTIELIRNAF